MELLKAIADNPELLKALREVLEKQFTLDVSVSQPNELIGQQVRARVEALRGIADAFREIEQYRTVKDKPERINDAR